MKRMLCFVLAAVLTCTLCACRLPDLRQLKPKINLLPEKATESPETQAPTTEMPTTAPVETEPVETEPPTTEPVETEPPLVPIELNYYDITLVEGDTIQLTAVVQGQKRLFWRSSNETVVLVNSLGVVTAISTGVANVTCYGDGAIEAACTVRVMPAETEPVVTEPVPPSESDYFIFPHSSAAYLTREEIQLTLSNLTGSPLGASFAQDAINEIYARNGYVFKRADLNAYYRVQPWYTPDESVDDDIFNQYEMANIELLKKFA